MFIVKPASLIRVFTFMHLRSNSFQEVLAIRRIFSLVDMITDTKGALAWYGKLTWESAHAWILKILCYMIVWGITLIYERTLKTHHHIFALFLQTVHAFGKLLAGVNV